MSITRMNSIEKESPVNGPINGTNGITSGTQKKRCRADDEEEGQTAEPKLRYKDKKKKITEDYISLVGDLLYPKAQFGPYGYNPAERKFPLHRMTTLGFLSCPLRKPTVVEKWSPYEIGMFEGSIMLYGKNFNVIQKHVKTKTVKEVIEFYYEWKKTGHYKQWKKQYIPDIRDEPASLSSNP